MMRKILIADPDPHFSEKLSEHLQPMRYECYKAQSGKDTQLKLFQHEFHCVILSFNIKNHSAIEVLNYIKSTNPFLRVSLLLNTPEEAKLLDLDNNLKKLGIASYYTRPIEFDQLAKNIAGDNLHKAWMEVKASENGKSHVKEEEVAIDDSEFIAVPINAYFSGNLVCFDIYVQLSSGRYLLILRKGESFDDQRLANYKNKGVSQLYFKKEDRNQMMDYYNHLLEKMLHLETISDQTLASTTKLSHQFVFDEMMTTGPDKEMIETSKKLVNNTINSIKRVRDLGNLVDNFFNDNPSIRDHSYLSCLYTSLICQNLDWVSPKSEQDFCLGSMLQNIGLSADKQNALVDETELNAENLAKYQEHPNQGYKVLLKYNVSENIRQIVLQHHEKSDGSGYPQNLSGAKIYPPAKIVYVAARFSELILLRKKNALTILGEFTNDRDEVLGCDPNVIRALITGFIKKKESNKGNKK